MGHCTSFFSTNYETLFIKEDIFINLLGLHIFDRLTEFCEK